MGFKGRQHPPMPVPAPPESTATLLGLLQKGDEAARTRLVERFLPLLWR